ncbi:MAG: TrkH family potassium uptake protein [Candidatus Coproplasma sp.]
MAGKFRFRLPTAAIFALSFLIIILIGTGLLCIPAATNSGKVDFLAAFFTATSATCVTGLAVVPTATHWSYFGQAVILLLIQIGGLGFITIISIFFFYVQKRASLSKRKLVMQSAGSVSLDGIKNLVKYILVGTFICEFIGAFLLCFSFVPAFGWGQGIWQSVFTSVSAFCNAGFTVTDSYGQDSLCAFVSDPLVNIVVCLLIIIGGIGFFVWGDIVKHRHKLKSYSLHSKIVLFSTCVLVVAGWILFALFEWNNPQTIGDYDVGTKILASLFLSVTPRTAGFNTVNTAGLSGAGSVLTVIYMFIGGSPGSTAGGVKTTTVAILFFFTVATSKRYFETHVFKRKLEEDALSQAVAIVFLYLAAIMVSALAIAAIEGASGVNSSDVVFEVVSAVGTVGLSRGITAGLHVASKLILIGLMFFGRVGGYTLILVFSKERSPVTISRVAEHIIVG